MRNPSIAGLLAGIWLLSAASAVWAAADKAGGETAGPGPATVLWFDEREPGVEPYRTRMIVVRDFVRMDDGADTDDFVLFDRRTGTIHSVSHEDRTVLEVPAREVQREPPYELELTEFRQPQEDAPKIAGRTPEHLVFNVNGQTCYEVVAVPDLLEDAVVALRQYHRSLAGEQAQTLDWTPPEMQTPCMLANVVFHPARHLAYGFPIQEWDYRGYVRALSDYREGVTVEADLFRLPEDYRRYRLEDIRARPFPAAAAGAPEASN
jgi:hypothetical protein